MVPVIAKAAIAVGVGGVFMETHENPENSTQSDKANQVIFDELEPILIKLKALDEVAKG